MTTSSEREMIYKLPTNDVFRTSGGVGHHYRGGYYFPGIESKMGDPLPPVLAKPSEIIPEDHYKTTTGTVHDSKYPFGPLQQPSTLKRAPGHNKVHYLKDFMENIPNRGWRRPLSPSHQKTETQEEFCNPPGLSEPNRWLNVQPFNLYNHHIDGPSKKIIPSTENSKLKGRTLYPKDQEVLRNLDPYMTTNMKYHRVFNPNEWNGIAKKDVPTYWDCEEYPRVLGFGPRTNLVPKSSMPLEQPMRDATKFKSATYIRRVPPSGEIVPHTGMLTEYDAKYVTPSDVKSKEAHICPIDFPCSIKTIKAIPDPNPKSKYSVPRMYETEYESYGADYPTVL